jgi:hypothetical protein
MLASIRTRYLPLWGSKPNPRLRTSTDQRRQGVRRQRYRPSPELLEGRALLSTFAVVTNANDSGSGSLRAAIVAVNHDTVNRVDQIDFNIPGGGTHTINLLSELPVLTHPVFINGGSESGIVLNGSTISGGGDGLVLDARHYAHAFSGEVQGLKLTGFADGIRVIDSSSSTPLTVQLLKNVVSLTSGGDGVQILAGTGSNSATVTNNRITVGAAGDAVVATTGGTSSNYTFSGNKITANGGGDGLTTNGTGSSNSLTYSGNTIKTTGGGDALTLYVSPSSPTTATILNNVLSTNGLASGLILTAGPKFQAMVQGNHFNGNLVGVMVVGNGTTAGVVDLGGGSLGSTGGNDFGSFKTATADSYAIGLFHVASSYSMTALDNVFSVTPTSVIADGHHDRAAGGSGSILV